MPVALLDTEGCYAPVHMGHTGEMAVRQETEVMLSPQPNPHPTLTLAAARAQTLTTQRGDARAPEVHRHT